MNKKIKILQKRFNSNNKLYIINILIVLFLVFELIVKKNNNNNKEIYNHSKAYDYKYSKFAIIQRHCSPCGLFSFYLVSLGCIHKYLLEGFIPIIDIKNFPNVINGYNISKPNHWEFFFF